MTTADRPPLDERILELLETYRQMTRVHLKLAGIDANPDYLGERLQLLEKKAMIHCTRPGVNFGKVPYVYSLAAAGAEVLASLWKTDRMRLHFYRQAPRISASQFSHRSWCITTHIKAARSHGDQLLKWIPEYGGAKGAATGPTVLQLAQGRVIRPDALFAIDHGAHGQMAYALEVHASLGAQLNRLVEQMEAHLHAHGVRSVSRALGMDAGTYQPQADFVTLILVPDARVRTALWQRLIKRDEFKRQRLWFLCKTYTELEQSFSDWTPLPEAA